MGVLGSGESDKDHSKPYLLRDNHIRLHYGRAAVVIFFFVVPEMYRLIPGP